MIKRIILALAASLSVAACSTTGSFTADFDETQNFSTYSTFSWADESPMTVFGERRVPPTAEPKIARAIREELEARGYTYVEDRTAADFAVSFSVGTRSEQEVTQMPNTFYANRVNWRWGGAYYPVGYAGATTTVSNYTEGTLAIDIFDVKRRAPVWHGAGVKSLSKSELRGEGTLSDPVKLREAVAKILIQFPPR